MGKIEKSIITAYDVALKLGVDNCDNEDKIIFKRALAMIASAAIDDCRSSMAALMYEKMDMCAELRDNEFKGIIQ